jgi:hypothetical protein
MRRFGPLLAAVLLAMTLAGCGPAVPAAMLPTLDGWRALGLACSAPREGNEPNDLLAWTCRGRIQGADLTAVVDGNDHGVFGLMAQVPAATDAQTAGEALAALAGATPFLADSDGAIAAWIRAAIDNDARTSTSLEGARISLEHDPTWITLDAFPENRPDVSGSVP